MNVMLNRYSKNSRRHSASGCGSLSTIILSIKRVGKIILLKIDRQKSKRMIVIRITNGECVEFDRVSRLLEYDYRSRGQLLIHESRYSSGVCTPVE
jgi:hypothetical protein